MPSILPDPVISPCCFEVTYDQTSIVIPRLDPTVPQTVESSFEGMSGWDTTTSMQVVTSVSMESVTLESPAVNFIWNTPLFGWNYSTNEFDGASPGARPLWGEADDRSAQITKFKGVDIMGGGVRLVDDYNFVSQPPPSNIKLDHNSVIVYHRRSSDSFVWQEHIKFKTQVDVYQWNKLAINLSAVSNLSAMLYNDIFELVVSGTNIPSDYIISVTPNDPLLINYYAVSGFNWIQPLTNESLGVPPTGGVWIPITTGELIEPLTPYKHMTNRHYPTIAAVPYPEKFYTIDDVGGYMIPKNLGVSTFVAKDFTTSVSTDRLVPDDQQRGITRVFQDQGIFNINYGLTKVDQNLPVSTASTDARWMKGSITEWSKAGMIITSEDHQEFIPYQTEYETTKINTRGIRRQGDVYDPWTGELDNEWRDVEQWPANIQGQHPIQPWYNQFDIEGLQLFTWKTDIFRNEFFLMKDVRNKTIHEKRQSLGNMWTRSASNVVSHADVSLKDVFNKFIYTDPNDGVISMDVWYDTLFIQTPQSLGMSRILFDYDTGDIQSTADLSREIVLCGRRFAGTWLDEASKKVTVAVLASAQSISGTYFYPDMYFLDLNSMKLDSRSFREDPILMSTFSTILTSVDPPILTYSVSKQLYNIAFIGEGAIPGMYFSVIDIEKSGTTYSISQAACISPVA